MKKSQVKTKVSFQGIKIYIGIDVHKKSWAVTIYAASSFHKTIVMDPSPDQLYKYLNRNFPQGNYLSVYESGFCGFSVHRLLIKLGIKNIIVNAADVPQSDKTRKQKSDPLDSKTLANFLRADLLTGIYIPAPNSEDVRQICRRLSQISKESTRTKNRIKSYLNVHGIKLNPDLSKSWSKAYIQNLKDLEFRSQESSYMLNDLLCDLEHHKLRKKSCLGYLRKISKTEAYVKPVTILRSIPGVGLTHSMVIISELFPLSRFKKFDQIASYAGLIPNMHCSGESEKIGHMTHRGNSRLKNSLIEASWVLQRADPAMLKSYNDLTKKMKGSKAIVRIAKKLLNRIVHIIKNDELYELGIEK